MSTKIYRTAKSRTKLCNKSQTATTCLARFASERKQCYNLFRLFDECILLNILFEISVSTEMEAKMQKWDYMVVRTFGGVVMKVDDREVGQITGGLPVGEMTYEFLDGLGRDGWEVVGMAGVRDGVEIILKRPLEEIASEPVIAE
jgi:hypothetical protein